MEDKYVGLRLSSELFDKIKHQAQIERRSISNFIRSCIEETIANGKLAIALDYLDKADIPQNDRKWYNPETDTVENIGGAIQRPGSTEESTGGSQQEVQGQ